MKFKMAQGLINSMPKPRGGRTQSLAMGVALRMTVMALAMAVAISMAAAMAMAIAIPKWSLRSILSQRGSRQRSERSWKKLSNSKSLRKRGLAFRKLDDISFHTWER